MTGRRDFVLGAAGLVAAASDRETFRFQRFDLVVANGRVIDPETRLDAIRHVGITGGRIAAVSRTPLRGPAVVDAAGLVVAPGFIDLHAHGQDLENNRVQALDGVTTALELETGPVDVDAWYAERAGSRLLNHGCCVGHIAVRNQVLTGRPTAGFNAGLDQAWARRPATASQIAEMAGLVDRGLARGALSVGFGIQYVPGATRSELLAMFRVARRHAAMCGVHQRYAGMIEPDGLAGLEELLAMALVTGAQLHVEHLTSNTGPLVGQALEMLAAARAGGIQVTTDTHPYTAAMTGIESAVFDSGWRERFQIDYGDLQWAATGERLTAESFERYRTQGGSVVIHSMKPEDVATAVAHPLAAIISDGELVGGRGHPRSAGTFCRVLGRFVREDKILTLTEALRKMTLYPAQILGARVGALRRKGRIQVGMDADLTVFDPLRVIDRATYDEPARPSEGVRHVIVAGRPVVREGEVLDAMAGLPVRGTRATGLTPSTPKP